MHDLADMRVDREVGRRRQNLLTNVSLIYLASSAATMQSLIFQISSEVFNR